MRDLKNGIEILLKYCAENDMDYSAEHDIIYFGPSTAEHISTEDLQTLEKLGFYFSDEYDCFYTFT